MMRKTPITAADLINDRVVPFYDAREVRLCRVLTDRGTEYCGNPEHHEYEGSTWRSRISTIRAPRPEPPANEWHRQERFPQERCSMSSTSHRTRKKILQLMIADLQVDLDRWVQSYNEQRPHRRTMVLRQSTPMQTFLDATHACEGENDPPPDHT